MKSYAMSDFKKLGVFYLGRPNDLATKSAKPGLLLYDSKDLVTHEVCVGMTGSGKTGLGLSCGRALVASLQQLCAWGNWLVRDTQRHLPARFVKSRDQAFGHEPTNLLIWEVYDRHNKLSH